MKKPQIIIVAGFTSLFTYMFFPDGDVHLIKRIDLARDGEHGRLLIHWESEHNALQALVGTIEHILDRYRPETWALACPSQHRGSLKSLLPRVYLKSLTECIDTDVSAINISNIGSLFTRHGAAVAKIGQHV